MSNNNRKVVLFTRDECGIDFHFPEEVLEFMGITESEAKELFDFSREELMFGVEGEKHFNRDDPRLVAEFEKFGEKILMSSDPRENPSFSFSIVEIPMDMKWDIRYEEDESIYIDEDGYEDPDSMYSHLIAKEYICEPHREFKPDVFTPISLFLY